MVSAARAPSAAVSVDAARHILLGALGRMPAEEVPLSDALGRVLAVDVVAATDLPGSDNSAMDGYAVLASDLAEARPSSPAILAQGLEARAGRPSVEHRPGTATIIATGAPMPRGADAVVPVEQTSRVRAGIAFDGAPLPGAHLRHRGEDVRAGTTILGAGRRLRSYDVGVCAAAGMARPWVGCRPRVALLSSGDELVPPGAVPEPHQVTDSNSAMLTAAVLEAGGLPVPIGVVGDDRAAISRVLERARDGADIIVSSAGVSMGAHDHIRECVAELGAVDQWKVAMRPGRPLVIGSVGATPFLGLPGNPVSSAVTFLLFARAAILALQGATTLLPSLMPVVLAEGLEKPSELETYVRVRLEWTEDRLVARSSGGQGSAMMHSLGAADALAILPAGVAVFAAGRAVQAMLLP